MQRVLSFQVVRGVNESNQFVTKRMCFSFVLSIGFITFLGGHTLGHFTLQRAIIFRDERRRLEIEGNGLENTEYLQRFMLKQLGRASLDPDFKIKWDSCNLKENDIYEVNNILSNLSLIEKVVKYQSHIVATARGAREPDRYVVLSASGKGVGIALKLAKIFNQMQQVFKWEPRRSIIFCLFSASSNPCPEILSSFLPNKIVAYIVVDHQALQGKGHFIVSGSDIVQFMVLESASIVKDWFSYDNQLLSSNNTFYNVTTSRLALDIPHAVLSYVNNNITYNEDHHERELRKIILAQIVGHTIWKFSESFIMKWNPSYFNNTALDVLKSINNTELLDVKEKVQQTLDKLLTSIKICNKKIDAVNNTFDTRILNDLLMDLDRILLCPDKQNQSRTDWSKFFRLSHEPSDEIIMYMNEVVKCYENAIQFLQDR